MTEANTPESLEHLGLPPIDQVGFVVKSLEDAKARYGALFGPFTEMDGSVEAAEYRGEIADAQLGILFGTSNIPSTADKFPDSNGENTRVHVAPRCTYVCSYKIK